MRKGLLIILLILVNALIIKSIEIQEEAVAEQGQEFTQDQLAELEQNSESHEFQAEVGRLMDIIINSLYSQKEVFIRELISNAADALDKIRFQALSDDSVLGHDKDLEIKVEFDKEQRTISFIDNGIGMTKEDLIQNLGTVAKSGTTQFIEAIKGGNLNLIGQFGVGFYASFLAANKVQVITKHNEDAQYIWESSAANEFKIVKDPRGNTLGRGTKVILHMKEEAQELVDETSLQGYIKKYSEFINFPIKLRVQKETQKEIPIDEEEVPKEDNDNLEVKDETEKKPKTRTISEKYWEYQVQNQNKAIWTRSTDEIEEEEYHKFYKSLSSDQNDPAAYTHFKTDGGVEFKSILYVPQKAQYNAFENYYQSKSQSIKLYVRRVLISDQFDDLMPRYLQFIKGIVDSDDLPLNVNREQLQQSKMLKQISRKLVKKSIEMLDNLARGDNEEDNDEEEEEGEEKTEKKEKKDKSKQNDVINQKYLNFYNEFGRFLKMGIMEDQANKAKLAKLLRFHTSYNFTLNSQNTQVSLADYVSRMKPNQKEIYYFGGESLTEIYSSPVIQGVLKKGYEVLLLDEAVDEFVFQHLESYDEKSLQNIGKGNFKLPDEDEQSAKNFKKIQKHYKELTKQWQDWMSEWVMNVQVSQRYMEDPVVMLASQYGHSANMEKLQKAQTYGRQQNQDIYVNNGNKKVLEINPSHPMIKELLVRLQDENENKEELKDIMFVLTQTALVNGGYIVQAPQKFSQKLYQQISNNLGVPKDSVVEEIDPDTIEDDVEEETVQPLKQESEDLNQNQQTSFQQQSEDQEVLSNQDEKDDL